MASSWFARLKAAGYDPTAEGSKSRPKIAWVSGSSGNLTTLKPTTSRCWNLDFRCFPMDPRAQRPSKTRRQEVREPLAIEPAAEGEAAAHPKGEPEAGAHHVVKAQHIAAPQRGTHQRGGRLGGAAHH